MLPTVHKRCLSAVFAALLGLLAAAPAEAAGRAKIKAAYPVDSDRDGHVDGVSLKWSGKVRAARDRKAPFAVKVRGYRVTQVGSARGKSQQVRVAERTECDTGGAVRLSFRPGKGTTPIRGAARKHKLDMRRFDVPVPRITCAVTIDADSDARVDGVRVTYSREVRSDAQTSGRFLFSVAGFKVKAVKAARGRFVEVVVAEHASPDSGATPAVGYSRPSKKSQRRFAVRAGRRKNAFSGSYQSTRDGVSPQLVAGETGDADRDGLLDAMTLRFSEPVNVPNTNGLAVLGMAVKPKVQVSGKDVVLTLAENTARGDARPGAWIKDSTVSDAAGNPALDGAVTPADAAPPVITAALTQDVGGATGRLDAVMVTFSEPVAHARDASGSYPFLLSGRSVTSVEAASGGRFVQVRFAEANEPDTGARPSVRYIPGAGLPVADAAGNDAAEGFVSSTDGVAPALVAATTTDIDDDGKIGSVLFKFSESVQHGAEGGNSSFGVTGYDATAAGAASGDEIAVTVSEKPAADSGATPTVTYSRDSVEDVSDAAGNITVNQSRVAADGARPVPLSVTTGDVDDDGRIDQLATTWSESLTHADDTAAPFAVSASGFSVARVRAASGTGLAVDLSEPAAHDTGSKPDLTYLGGGATIRDAAGLEPTQRTWAGMTADALKPRLVSATTGDDGDGQLDSIALRFSEAVVHAQETTPGSFTAGAFTITSAQAATGDTVELKLTQSGTGDTGARPAVSYAPDGQEDVRDPAGNFANAASIAQAADGARPVLLSAATADVDDNGRLDRVSTGWSETLVHADDSAAPFPLSAEVLSISRVHAAAGQTLEVDLTEPSAADTGSAPDLTYAGGADPITDAAGLEPAQTSYPGVTRDALPPRKVSTATADGDTDGKIDAIDIQWSEAVTGATGTAPYAVTGRTLGANVSFGGATTRVPFTEDPAQFDTHDTPQIAYDAGSGDLHDIAEGAGDTTADAPAIATETPLDKAAPILVAAKTADVQSGSPNGTIDAVLTTFSEPIAHSPDGLSPFSLNVAGRTEVDVEGDGGAGDRTLYVRVTEAASPDGGLTPNVSVQAAGPVADHIYDRAATPNEALVMTFSGTTDEVRPVLMSAQLGERPGGACTKDAVAGIDGEVDCVLTTWSEEVEHADDTTAPFSLSSSNPSWGIPASGIGQLGPATTLEIPLTASGTKDRDSLSTTVSYDGDEDTPVVDDAAVPNEALDGTKPAEAACKDVGLEGNDSRHSSNPELETTDPSFQRKCAFDDDWYTLQTDSTGFLEVHTRPTTGVDLNFEVYDPSGNLVTPSTVVETGAAGQVDQREYSPLSPDAVYWVRVTANEAPTPNEGAYCVVFSDDSVGPNEEPGCGPLAGQIVFTEVGLGNDKFVEIKNDFDIPVDLNGASANLVLGDDGLGTERECSLVMPSGLGASMVEPEEHVIIQETNSATAFGCDVIDTLGPAGEKLTLEAGGNIDVVDFTGVIDSPVVANHSLQFVPDAVIPDTDANNDVATNWCRTFTTDSKGATGDGCDEYRINEVLWRPASTAGASDGKAFVELAGNIPAKANSGLLASWVLRGVNGRTGEGTVDFTLPGGASPRSNGTYVVADGVSGVTQVSTYDTIWDILDLSSPQWPDNDPLGAGPRGIQLLQPNPGNNPPCTGSADAFGWTTTAQGFSNPLDNLRACPAVEGQEYTTSTVGSSAARDNLSSASDTTYNENNDGANNKLDFCPQATPNPASLNIRNGC